jgi:flavin-binding protein dodecin
MNIHLEKEVIRMSAEPRVARVTEIIAGSPKGFEEAVKVGFARATKTLRGITGLKVIEMRVAVENSKVIEYRVRLEVIFVLET